MWLPPLKALAANIVVVISVFGYGTWISRILPDSFSRFTRVICALIGGFGLLGLILFVIGQLSFTRWTIGAILAAGVLSAVFSKLRPWGIRTKVAAIPATTVGVVLAITALSGLLEPIGDWNYDGVAYHLVGAKVWLRNGIVRPIPDNAPTSYPSTAELVFAALYAFGGDRAPWFSATWTLALLLAMAAAIGRRCGLDHGSAWWIAALIVTMPAAYGGSVGAFVDAIYAAFILAALRVGLDATQKKHFIACGIFCGLAMATKYPGLVALPALALCAAWAGEKRKGIRALILNAATVAAAACVIALSIYLRNLVFLGSPIYPPPAWAGQFLHVKYMSLDAMRAFYGYTLFRAHGHGGGIVHFIALPFNLTYHTADFNGAGGIGLAPLALAPLGVFASWREPFARRLALAGFVLLCLWFLTAQESRYLIHFYALCAVFAVLGWQFAVSITARRGRFLCAAVIAISVAYGLFMIVTPQISGARALFLPAIAKQRRKAWIPFVESFDYLNRDPQVTRVLILDRSVVTYYLDKDYVKPFGQWREQVYPDMATPADALSKLHELQISHVLDVQSTISGFCVPQNYPGLLLVFERPGQRVYKVVKAE